MVSHIELLRMHRGYIGSTIHGLRALRFGV